MAIESLDDIKKLPPRHKAIAAGVLYALLAYFFWFFLLQSAWEERAKLQSSLEELGKKIAAQEKVVAQKEKYLRELRALDEQFRLALLKLPERKEIPALLWSIAKEGKISGLDFVLFEPIPPPPALEQKPVAKKEEAKKPEADKEQFYETIQIHMTVSGSFHKTALFLDRLAKLPRIINLDQITVGDRAGVKERPDALTTSAVIKTYMFKSTPLDGKKVTTDEKSK